MKTRQEQIEAMMLEIPQTIVAYDMNPKGQHLYGEQRLQIAEVLSDKGYGNVSEYKAEIERLKAENVRLTEKLGRVLLAVDTVKEMNAMCNIDKPKEASRQGVCGKIKRWLRLFFYLW